MSHVNNMNYVNNMSNYVKLFFVIIPKYGTRFFQVK